MKVLLVIDHFGTGGAQRQIVELACGLQQRGHAVEMFIYFPQHNFFRPRLEAHHIVVHEVAKGRGFSPRVLGRLASLMRKGGFDIVVSYLSTANIYAELAKALARGPTLVVSERTTYHDDKSVLSAGARRLLHALADEVVTNSQTQCEWLKTHWWLKNKVSCIYNGVDANAFRVEALVPRNALDLRLVAIGRIGPEKNLLNLIRGLRSLHEKSGNAPHISWVGARDTSTAGQKYCEEVDELLRNSPAIQQRWQWLGVQSDIPAVLRRHHALIHPSFYEGLPNVVCEALAAGMPVLASNVCDHPLLVADGKRGFLFDPREPASIAAAIEKLGALDASQWLAFSGNARAYAVASLGVDRMIVAYESLFERLVSGHNLSARRGGSPT